MVRPYFWATWCGPCKIDAPQLSALYHANKNKGLEIIGVNMDYDMVNLRPFAQHYNMTWRQTYDGKGWKNAIAQRFGVQSIPFSLIIGRDGKIVQPQKLIDGAPLETNSNTRAAAVLTALAQKAE